MLPPITFTFCQNELMGKMLCHDGSWPAGHLLLTPALGSIIVNIVETNTQDLFSLFYYYSQLKQGQAVLTLFYLTDREMHTGDEAVKLGSQGHYRFCCSVSWSNTYWHNLLQVIKAKCRHANWSVLVTRHNGRSEELLVATGREVNVQGNAVVHS